jgi:ankyrin repeat protein
MRALLCCRCRRARLPTHAPSSASSSTSPPPASPPRGLTAAPADALTRSLLKAARIGSAELVALALARGAPAGAADADGTPAIVRAASLDHAAAVEELLRGGADPEARDADGFTALLASAWKGRARAAAALLRGGADAHAVVRSAAAAAGGRGRGRAAGEVVADDDAMALATEAGHAEIIQLLIEHHQRPKSGVAGGGAGAARAGLNPMVIAASWGASPRAI